MNSMMPLCRNAISGKAPLLVRLTLSVGIATVAAACAPEAIRSNQATGFNGYFRQLPTACRPLIIGGQNVGDDIQMNNTGAPNYAYFTQVTAKLYYHQLSPPEYRQAVVGFLGAGADSERSIDCIIRTLPADRPTAPIGTD
ncbi:MAG TPA: hypothetical protein VEN29_13385 [Casimicrobiaceae bacterium]|nr:hypothetical protein [Casimicrobiaceae bacterium]